MAKSHVLYRFYSSTGQLLYVGITADPPQRFKAHQGDKDWWETVSGITVETYPSREDLAAAERRAIQVERPEHNVVYNGPHRKATPTSQLHSGQRIIYRCNTCGGPVAPKRGYIHVSLTDARKKAEAWKELKARKRDEARKRGDALSIPVYSGSELLNLPEPARWHVHHENCDPDPDHYCYWFDVGRADSYEKLLNWTLHMGVKRWFKDTNWEQFVYSYLTRKDV